MTNPGGRIWVDPEGLVDVGNAYEQHALLYNGYLRQLSSLRQRYGKSWGDDELGTKFSEKFLTGLDNLESLVKNVKGTLDYTAEGLRSSGRLYRTVNDEATEVSHQMAHDFDTHLPGPGTRQHALKGETAPPAGTHYALAEFQPMQQFRSAVAPDTGEGETSRTFLRSVKLPEENPSIGEPHLIHGTHEQLAEWQPGERLLQTGEQLPGRTEFVEGERSFRRLQPMEPLLGFVENVAPLESALVPATSQIRIRPEYTTAYVDGAPLTEGYRLQAFHPFPDGMTRLDVNLYESVSPVGHLPVTTADGQPIEPGDGQLFVVKENPNVDPSRPGYQPLYVEFAADGTAIPLVTDLS